MCLEGGASVYIQAKVPRESRIIHYIFIGNDGQDKKLKGLDIKQTQIKKTRTMCLDHLSKALVCSNEEDISQDYTTVTSFDVFS